MGTRSASGQVKVVFGGTIANLLDASSTGTPSINLTHTINQTFTTGTTAGKADRVWLDKGRTLSQSATEDLDLYDLAAFDCGAGAGLDALGQAWTIADVLGILVYNQSTSVGSLIVGNKNATSAFAAMFNASDTGAIGPIKPGGIFMIYNPTDPSFAVADTTDHLLTFTESGVGAVTFDVGIIARSA